MKKLSKKKRAELKERAAIREKSMAKAGKPYSLHKIHVCRHFTGRGGGIVSGDAYPTLIKISEDKCMCTTCKKEFPAEFVNEMIALTKQYAYAGCSEVSCAKMRLNQKCKPVSYYFVGPGEMCYVDS